MASSASRVLANALHEDGAKLSQFALSYDLRDGELIRTGAVEDPLHVPLPVLFDLQKLLKWFSQNPEVADYLDLATGITRSLRQYEVPAYLVSQDDPTVLQDIFDGMNNYGKRLSRAEVFAALHATGDESQLQDSPYSFDSISERIDSQLQFGAIDNDTVLATVLARRGADVRRDIRTEFADPKDEGRDGAYAAAEEALRRAVQFLQNDAQVPHVSMLAYRYLLVVLARVFALHPTPDSRSLSLLRRWYWQAAVAGPGLFRGGTPNAARVLCGRVIPDDLIASVTGLLATVNAAGQAIPEVRRFSTNEAATKILLCSWWAAQPRSPITGERYDRTELASALQDQPTARDAVRYLLGGRGLPVQYRQLPANRALMPTLDYDSREVSGLLLSRPIAVDAEQWMRVLESHALDEELIHLLEEGREQTFLDRRQDRIVTRLRHFLQLVCEWDFEDTPPLRSLVLDEEDDDEDWLLPDEEENAEG